MKGKEGKEGEKKKVEGQGQHMKGKEGKKEKEKEKVEGQGQRMKGKEGEKV